MRSPSPAKVLIGPAAEKRLCENPGLTHYLRTLRTTYKDSITEERPLTARSRVELWATFFRHTVRGQGR